jgi:DNA-binding NarL/FixJ family response regulator
MRISGFILVIDSYLIRKGLVALLNRIQGVRVLKEYGAEDSFVHYLEKHSVNFIIIGQYEFQRNLNLFISKPELLEKIILVEGDYRDVHIQDVSEFDLKTSINLMEDRDALMSKIHKLLEGKDNHVENHSMVLSPRETTIVRLVSMGHTNREIAEKLFLSAHTVMTHRKNINNKLGIKSVSGLTIYAIVNNIITIEEHGSLPSK